jgi:hypothetical protein
MFRGRWVMIWKSKSDTGLPPVEDDETGCMEYPDLI